MKNQKVIVFGVDGLIPELIYKFSSEGYLPNIKKMLANGSSSKLFPFISTWGDVNWVSFMTGQSPGISWRGQGQVTTNEDNLIGLTNSFGKKGALVHFPNSLSTEGTDHFNFAPFQGQAPFELAPPKVFSTNINKWPKKEKKESLGWPPTASIAHHDKNNRSEITRDNGVYSFNIEISNGKNVTVNIEPVDHKNIRLLVNNNIREDVSVGNWSEWVRIPLGDNEEGIVRFNLAHYDLDNLEIDLIQSQFNRTTGLSNDLSLEEFLLDTCGPFISTWAIKASPDERYYETGFEEAEYQAMWLAEAALTLLEKKQVDYFATVFRLNDETHHTSLAQYDPSSPFYSEEQSQRYEKNMRNSYIVLDKVIGELLNRKSDDTTVILASDHGNVPNHYFCDIYLRLAECNLCELDDNGLPILSRSKAYLKDDRGGLEVYINLEGREEHGIVSIDDYELVQNEIFHAITTWSHILNDNPVNVAALTLKKARRFICRILGPRYGGCHFCL